jgi:hypothetical protein
LIKSSSHSIPTITRCRSNSSEAPSAWISTISQFNKYKDIISDTEASSFTKGSHQSNQTRSSTTKSGTTKQEKEELVSKALH